MSKTITSLFLSLVSALSLASQENIVYLHHHDTVIVSVAEYHQKTILHKMREKQTLYGLAKFYGISLADLYHYNPKLLSENTWHIGQSINIPIPNRAITRYKNFDFRRWHYAPLYYEVKSGETLYKIAKKYFKMEISHLKEMNQLEDNIVSSGQLLQVGWLSTKGIPDSLRYGSGKLSVMWSSNAKLKQIFLENAKNKKRISLNQVGYCDNTSSDIPTKLFALHRTAPLGSIIELYNPFSNRRVYVKVIGRVPLNHPKTTHVIVHRGVAQMLRVEDDRFYLKVSWYK